MEADVKLVRMRKKSRPTVKIVPFHCFLALGRDQPVITSRLIRFPVHGLDEMTPADKLAWQDRCGRLYT